MRARSSWCAIASSPPPPPCTLTDCFFHPQAEAKAGLKARVEAELAVAADDADMQALREKFAKEERAIEHEIDQKVHTFSTALNITYNFLSK